MNEEFYDMIESKIKDPSDYHDIREVFNFMRDFCKDNGGHIIPYDRPRQLKIGWLHFETGFYWSIKIQDVKMVDGVKMGLLKQALSTEAGKLNLCSALCGQDITTFYSDLEEKYKENPE